MCERLETLSSDMLLVGMESRECTVSVRAVVTGEQRVGKQEGASPFQSSDADLIEQLKGECRIRNVVGSEGHV